MASKITIDLLLPRRNGGVVKWGEDLVEALSGKDFTFRVFRGEKAVLKYLLFSKKGDLIHTTIPLPWKPGRRPLILTIHGFFKKEKNIWSKIYPHVIKLADKITTPTQWLKEKLDLPQIQVIPNGIFLNQEIIKKNFNFNNKNEINILTITNFNFYEKCHGIKFIYEAFKQLDLSGKKIIFHILGDGEFRNNLEKEMKSQNKLKVIFHGFQKPDPFFKKADIFVHYSFLDILPLVLLEAMNYGLPIISNNFGAASEIIDDKKNGLIINSSGQLARAIKKIIENDSWANQLGKKARLKAEEQYDWYNLAGSWSKIYQSLI